MRISAKARYGLAALIYLGQNYEIDENITIIRISEHLEISKIYLEQVFSLLKRGEIVTSIKGSSGGYKLTTKPELISVYTILASIEVALFEEVKDTVEKKASTIERAMSELIFTPLDKSVKKQLQDITLADLIEAANRSKDDENYMFYI